MYAFFSRRVVLVAASSQSRHFLSHLLPSGLSSSSSSATRFVPSLLPRPKKVHGFFASTLGNTHLKHKLGYVLGSRVRFFSSELPSVGFESKGFIGFQKRGWKSWFNGANGVVFGLIIANAAVFTMWRVSAKDRKWIMKNFMLSKYNFLTGRIHTLVTSGFTNVGTNQILLNMIGLCYFGTRIARTLGGRYLLKLYFAGTLGSSVFFLSNHALSVTSLKGKGVAPTDQVKVPIVHQGADGPVFAITLLDMFIYPKVTTYLGLVIRVPVLAGVLFLGLDLIKMLEGKQNNVSSSSSQLGGVVVAVMAWARLRKGRFC
ncbi:PREDICTED: rhomboid-like protein 16, chloroplastic [Camelina sativa]|uniref:Rhomboid-like protein 16, chloroplastic n=1 Tax=Camelina sativa TaxID=90675 RepID=A0ABM0WPR5_CAMSA|nr:PREDICTED: rhomboid-like protein 16, chloroplastic [Camelina sativa]